LDRAKPNAFGTQKEVKEIVEKITQSSNGDIRSAVMALEFIYGGGNNGDAVKGKKRKKSKRPKSDQAL
jgi:replication-associated recombination protein RarA